MKTIARITPDNPINLERLEVQVTKSINLLKAYPTFGVKALSCNTIKGSVYVELDIDNDELAARMKDRTDWNTDVEAQVLWL